MQKTGGKVEIRKGIINRTLGEFRFVRTQRKTLRRSVDDKCWKNETDTTNRVRPRRRSRDYVPVGREQTPRRFARGKRTDRRKEVVDGANAPNRKPSVYADYR